jgi:exosortase K
VTPKVCLLVIVALAAWGLKHHYARAGAEDLRWILRPTASAVAALTGTTFTLSPDEGYLSRDRLFLIEKSCAGINFMIAAFGMLAITLRHRARSAVSAAAVLAGVLGLAYVSAVLVNTARIAVAMWLAVRPGLLTGLTADQLHRVEGIAVYFGGLLLLFELARRLDGRTVPLEAGR